MDRQTFKTGFLAVTALWSWTAAYAKPESTKTAPARQYSLGGGMSIAQSIYRNKQDSSDFAPFVSINYRGFYINSSSFGYHYKINESLKLGPHGVLAAPAYLESDSELYQGMGDREYLVYGGLAAEYKTGWLTFKLGSGQSLSSNGGLRGSLKTEVPFVPVAEKDMVLVLTPSISVSGYDQKDLQYRYGVEKNQQDLARDRPAYQPASSSTYTPAMSFVAKVDGKWVYLLQVSKTFFPVTVSDSPLVNKNSALTTVNGISYIF